MNKTIEIFENAIKNLSEAVRLLDIELPKYNGWLATIKNNEINALKSINEKLLNDLKELQEFENLQTFYGDNKL